MSIPLQPTDTIITDLDGVFHDHPTGSGALVWANIAHAGFWDGAQNKNGHNGRSAVQAFFAETKGVLDPNAHNVAADNHLLEFVRHGQKLGLSYDEFIDIAKVTIQHITKNNHLHDKLVTEVADHRKASPEKPTIFITFSPLVVGKLLVEQLYGSTGTFVFSPYTVSKNRAGEATFVNAYQEIEFKGKGVMARQLMRDFCVNPLHTTGFGDTASDISLLDVLARPFAVKPTAALRTHALTLQIPILEEEHVRESIPSN